MRKACNRKTWNSFSRTIGEKYVFLSTYSRRMRLLFSTRHNRFTRKAHNPKNKARFSQNQEENVILYIQPPNVATLSSIMLTNEQELERNFLLFNSVCNQGERISYWEPKWGGNVFQWKNIERIYFAKRKFSKNSRKLR